jgi:hypothetical protein
MHRQCDYIRYSTLCDRVEKKGGLCIPSRTLGINGYVICDRVDK